MRPEPSLTHAELDRATLARQGLLERRKVPLARMLEQVVGLQAQEPRDPYVALYARVAGFRPETLERALARRQVVRMALMRSTIHLVTARDALALRPLVQPVIARSTLGSHGRRLAGVPHAAVAEEGRRFLAEGARSFSDVGRHLHTRWPGAPALDLAQLFRALVPLVQVPPRGFWSDSGAPLVLPLDGWLGARRPPGLDLPGLVRRYLAGFGPATLADAQAWSGLTRLREASAGLALRSWPGALLDLPRAPRPAGDAEAPVRLLPVYDNAILGYRDRRRILPAAMPDLGLRQNEAVRWVLLDGVVGAAWWPRAPPAGSVARRVAVEVRPFARLPAALRRAVEDEAHGLMACLWPDRAASVRWLAPRVGG